MATSYDAVPYDNLAFAQTHPDRLAVMARIFGLQPPPVATCRVLELGCASGGNLLPMAVNLPDAQFLGIDLSQRQIARGLETISAVGIRNATLQHASILDVTREWGAFDYILCHGVFSWVERDVQDAILRIAKENLAPTGVAYVSYNTYPGWHMREAVRHMMRYHAGRFETPAEQIEQARALLEFLTSAAADTEPFGQLLTREVERLNQATDSYLFHEHLEQTNAPMYFHQFIERAESAGLQYLAEAEISDMLSSMFPQHVAETLERISPDILHIEQYMDFVRNRLFRQTLLCHKSQRPSRALSPAVLRGLMVSCRVVAQSAPLDLTSNTPVIFSHGPRRAEVRSTLSKAAYHVLSEIWPHALDVDDLCEMALERAAPFLSETPVNASLSAMMSDVFAGVMHGMIRLHTQQLPCANRVSDIPEANVLAAFHSLSGAVVVNAHHEAYTMDPFEAEVLRLANGTRHIDAILLTLLQRVARGEILFEVDGATNVAPETVRRILPERVAKTLSTLAHSAVLTA